MPLPFGETSTNIYYVLNYMMNGVFLWCNGVATVSRVITEIRLAMSW